MPRHSFVIAAALALLAGCESPGMSPEMSAVRVRLAPVEPELRASRNLLPGGGPRFTSPPDPVTITLSGTNGVLEITQLTMLVSDLRLEHAAGSCDAGGADCIPLRADAVQITLMSRGAYAQAVVPEGEYTGIRLQLEDLDADDETDPASAARVRELARQIRTSNNQWPVGATMQAMGTFRPTGGTPQSFRVYFAGEGEVVEALDPALHVRRATTGASLRLDVEKFLRAPNGALTDLSARTGQLIDLGDALADAFYAHVDTTIPAN